jgi:hypothetical protein
MDAGRQFISGKKSGYQFECIGQTSPGSKWTKISQHGGLPQIQKTADLWAKSGRYSMVRVIDNDSGEILVELAPKPR